MISVFLVTKGICPRHLCILTVMLTNLFAVAALARPQEPLPAKRMMVMMRDSVSLATLVYASDTSSAQPCILIRTPKPAADYSLEIGVFLDNAFTVVLQNTRGRHGSEGIDSLFLDDGLGEKTRDGFDTVQWLATQPFCNGKIGTFGRGLSGYTQFLLAGTAPPKLTAQYIVAAPYNFYDHVVFPGGAFQKSLVDNILKEQDRADMLALWEANPSYNRFWARLNSLRGVKAVNVPTAMVTGWYDAYSRGTIEGFQRLKKYASDFARAHGQLIIGPWTDNQDGFGKRRQGELTYPENAEFDVLAHAVRWFDQWLKGIDRGVILEPPVKYYMMGAVEESFAPGNEWQTAATWPPPNASPQRFYLKKDGILDIGESDKKGMAEGFVFDPDHPVPTRGGANMYLEAGPLDQSGLETRSDVFIYTTPTLETPVAVAGRLRVKLYAMSTAYDTDFTAKITDVYPDGRSMLVADGIVRARYRKSRTKEDLLDLQKATEFWIDLGNTGMVFNADHRIRLAISSSNSPRFEPNPNAPQPFHKHPGMFLATNTVYYGGKRASYLELPVVLTPVGPGSAFRD